MKFITTVSLKEYIKLMYILTYKRGWMIFITIIGLLMLCVTIIYLSGTLPILFQKDYSPWTNIIFGFLFLVAIPFSVYFSSKRNYFATKRLHEQIEYEFSNETMKLTGESFNTEMKWDQTYKIEELNNWFLIYQSKKTANLIPKTNLTAEQIQNLRNIFKSLENVRTRLKEN